MFELIDIKSGKAVEKHKGDFREFISEVWGGWHPFELDGTFHSHSTRFQGCEDYSKYWRERN